MPRSRMPGSRPSPISLERGSGLRVIRHRAGAILAMVTIFTMLASTAPSSAQVIGSVPSAPTDVRATPGDASAIVSWQPPGDDGGQPITGYTVTASPGAASATTVDTSTTVTGLANGTAYTFTVVATNDVGDGSPSAPSNAATPAADIVVNDLTESVTPSALVQVLVGDGVQAENVTYTGANAASGTFSSGNAVGFDEGIVLTSGDAENVIGPNTGDVSGASSSAGDADLTSLVGATTHDAAVLEFDFTPTTTPIYFSYVFSSEEYNFYVNSSFNDVFGFFVDGSNCALVPDTSEPVSINTINGGNPFGAENASHPDLYNNNDHDDPGPPALNTQMNGLTDVLTCQADVTPDQPNHMKLAIADTSDSSLDSAVFLEAGSFSTIPPEAPGAPTNVQATAADAEAVVSWDPPADEGTSPISGYTVTSNPGDHAVQTPDGTTTQATVPGLTNGQAYTFTVHATNDAGDGPESDPSGPVTPTGATETGADLRTTTDDTPDPVNEENNVEYAVRVTNDGPETASNVVLQDTPPEGTTLISVEGPGFNCDGGGEGTVECTIDTLAPGEFATVSIVVRAPGVSEGSEIITNSATASADQSDPTPGNNDDDEQTTVEPRSVDESTGFISTEGGTINTDVGAAGPDPEDFTVLRMRFGPGPGGEATLRELDCPTDSIFAPCIGNIAEMLPPQGYERIVGVLLEDDTIDPGTPKRDLEVLYQKQDGDPLVSLERCHRNPELPCILAIKRLEGDPSTDADNVLRFRLLLDSDPKFAPR